MTTTHPEHALQVAVVKWCREAITVPYLLNSIDRRAATGQFSHAREKARGCVAGWPDVLLLVQGFPAICIELKAPGKKPDERQLDVMARLRDVGAYASWAECVEGVAVLLLGWGVPLSVAARQMAAYHDRRLAMTHPPKPRAKAMPRKEKPTAARIARAHASGVWK